MNTTRRTVSATSRLISWLKNPFPAKLHSVLVRAIGVAKIFDGETFRRAYFDTLDPNRQFSVSTHGSEKYVVLNSDKAISRTLFIKGSFDFDKVEKVISVMSAVNKAFKLETLIDVGANIGTVCIPAVKRGLAANAIAIEPEPLNYRVLVANIFLNDLADKIKTYNLALGSEDNQTLELELSAGHSGDHRIHVANETGRAPPVPAKLLLSNRRPSTASFPRLTETPAWSGWIRRDMKASSCKVHRISSALKFRWSWNSGRRA